MKQEIHEMEYKYLTVLNEIEDDITRRISEITKISVDLNKMLDLKDVCLIAKYNPRNAWYRVLPPKLKVSLPNFSPQKINSMVIYQKFVFLPKLSIREEKNDYAMNYSRDEITSPKRFLMSKGWFQIL